MRSAERAFGESFNAPALSLWQMHLFYFVVLISFSKTMLRLE